MVQPSVAVNDLPANVLAKILVGTSDDLCRHLSLCARVCTDWCATDTHARASPQRRTIANLPLNHSIHHSHWRYVISPNRRRVALSSDGYGTALSYGRLPNALKQITSSADQLQKRARVLRFVSVTVSSVKDELDLESKVQRLNEVSGSVGFSDELLQHEWGTEAQLVLGAALLALPTEQAVTRINATGCGFTPKGFAPISELIGRGGLSHLYLGGNDLLDNVTVSQLVQKLPPTLQALGLACVGLSDAGMVALAAVLPKLPALSVLTCGGPGIADAGWRALAAALPQMGALEDLKISDSPTFGDSGMSSLVAALPGAPVLQSISVLSSNVGDVGAHALAQVLGRCTALRLIDLSENNQISVDGGRAALRVRRQ